jgi:hypothetical protein
MRFEVQLKPVGWGEGGGIRSAEFTTRDKHLSVRMTHKIEYQLGCQLELPKRES